MKVSTLCFCLHICDNQLEYLVQTAESLHQFYGSKPNSAVLTVFSTDRPLLCENVLAKTRQCCAKRVIFNTVRGLVDAAFFRWTKRRQPLYPTLGWNDRRLLFDANAPDCREAEKAIDTADDFPVSC